MSDRKILPRKTPFPEYDIAIGDNVIWVGKEEWGLWFVNSMNYVLNDGRKAASVIPVSEFKITDRERFYDIAPLDELKTIRDCEWLGYPENHPELYKK